MVVLEAFIGNTPNFFFFRETIQLIDLSKSKLGNNCTVYINQSAKKSSRKILEATDHSLVDIFDAERNSGFYRFQFLIGI